MTQTIPFASEQSLASQVPWTPSPDDFDEMWDAVEGPEHEPDAIPDMLCTMFQQQFQHMQAYAEINPDAQLEPHLRGQLDHRQTQAALREFAGYMTEELYEAVNLLKNKPWKQTDKPTDRTEFEEEMSDFFHFTLEFFILAGIDPIDLFKAYFRKAFINKQRQQNEY